LDILNKIAADTSIPLRQVAPTVKLLDEENTVPFIARYRKEWTGGLDETQIREIERKMNYFRLLEERRATILDSIEKQGKLTDELKERIMECEKLQELEDLYLPYKPKRRTRATIAKEKGLEPLADKVMDEAEPEQYAAEFVDEEKGVKNIQEALQGAMDIVAERVAEEADIRSFMREAVLDNGILEVKAKEMKPNSEFEMYKEYKEPVAQVKPHRVLAINRGEKVNELSAKIEFPDEFILKNMKHYFVIEENRFLNMAIEDSYKRLLKPSIEREVRSILTEKSEDQAIEVFSSNLNKLLMQAPLKGFVVMGLDPGIRTGTKIAIIDKHGNFLAHAMIFQDRVDQSATVIQDLVKKYGVQIIAIGNGTGFRDVEKVVAGTIKAYNLECKYTVVPETGASIYSASEIAREEFPDLDLTIRGAISIGRRLQDPISELVKIEPKSLGVGQYQHDVEQGRLSQELDKVVEDCVNQVGVNLNTASYSLLKYVSGINSSLARKIVTYRKMKGAFSDRDSLKTIKGLGEKAYEQAAGFLKIPDGKDPLDNTWVHPENYEVARQLLEYRDDKNKIQINQKQKQEISKKYNVGMPTLEDIISALERPNLDPRDDIEKPILREEILSLKDLKKGMILKGTVRNVVDFGAFVDIGIKNDGLVHISEVSTKYVKHPLEAVQLGDIVDVMVIDIDEERGRVGLSIKQVLEQNQTKAKEKAK
jgi:uncharacterized protein